MPRRDLVWDCATGNGQAARDLARYFKRVVATDSSAEQIAHAVAVSNVEYRVAPADASGLASQSADLVTVAQALHWFAGEPFFDEVRRVLVPNGVIAAWSYGSCHAGSDMEADLREFENGLLGPYWNPERRWVDEHYKTIPFPFRDLPAPGFELRADWTLRQLGGYLQSWSAVAKYRRVHGTDPVGPLLGRLAGHWGGPDRVRQVTWPLNIRVGRVG
ncbi:MAG TPA: class I SAM-dependent methyltransferase [Gemmatimonadaceae bacterium]|nr:class I SAM-dependent methyltransferase [Gemmatimonadaceae bacterium]